MTTNIDSYGLSKIYVNDNLAHSMNWESNYDGENLNVALATGNNKDNNKYFIQLSNDDILGLLNYPVSNKTLEERLTHDFDLSLAGDVKHHRHHKSHKSPKHHHKHHKHHRHHKHHKLHKSHKKTKRKNKKKRERFSRKLVR